MVNHFQPGAAFAHQMDDSDPLKSFRDEFVISDPDLIYLDGNSLGRMPKATAERIRTVVDQEWGDGLIRGWNAGWWSAPARIGAKIAQIVGAKPHEIIVCDSTSVDLFKLAISALRAQEGRTRVVSDVFNFPSDLYILQGAIDLLGNKHTLSLVGTRDTITPDLGELADLLDSQTALVELSHVVFKSGYLYDMKAVTEQIHAAGALVIWDLCHSVGAVPVELNACHADLAIGCTYKYLNAGPGANAFLYVREDLQEKLRSPIWGWLGQRDPFAFDLQYKSADGMARFLAGSVNVLSTSAVEPAVDMIERAGMARIRVKSIMLTEYMTYLYDQHLAARGFTFGSPREASRRGSHISIRHPEAYRICRAMTDVLNVIPDFRAPDNIRIGLVPLYTTFGDIHEAVMRICRIMDERIYERFGAERAAVT
ncbi:MAG: kynureninase [Chloroflexi bacterium]|nr:kynureninase [Chloroflexota bacterium]